MKIASTASASFFGFLFLAACGGGESSTSIVSTEHVPERTASAGQTTSSTASTASVKAPDPTQRCAGCGVNVVQQPGGSGSAIVQKDPPNEDPPNQDPPNEDPPNQDPLNEDPPNEDPPNEDPPNQDPPNQDPPNQDPPENEQAVIDPDLTQSYEEMDESGLEPITEEECTAGPPQCPPDYANDYGPYWLFCNENGCTLTELGEDDEDESTTSTSSLLAPLPVPALSSSDFSGTYEGGMSAVHSRDSRTAAGDVTLFVALPAVGDYSIDVDFSNVMSNGLDVSGEFSSWAGISMSRDESSFGANDIAGQFVGDSVSGTFQDNDWDGSYSADRED